MEKRYDQALQAKLISYLGEDGHSQQALAEKISSSGTAISLYKDSNYDKGDVQKLEEKLREFFANEEEAAIRQYTPPDYVPTSISTQIYSMIRLCHLRGNVVVEVGDPGIGKSRTAKKYIEDHPHSATYMAANPCISTEAAVMKQICRILKLPTGRKNDMWMDIADYFNGGRKVLIIDEVQHLPTKTIEAIRSLFDSAPEAGVVLMGNPVFLKSRTGVQEEIFKQTKSRSRLIFERRAREITMEDVRPFFPDLEGREKELELMHAVAKIEGIRGAIFVYENAVDNSDTSYKGLLAAAKGKSIY